MKDLEEILKLELRKIDMAINDKAFKMPPISKAYLDKNGEIKVIWRSYFEGSETFNKNFKARLYLETCNEIANLHSTLEQEKINQVKSEELVFTKDILPDEILYKKLLERLHLVYLSFNKKPITPRSIAYKVKLENNMFRIVEPRSLHFKNLGQVYLEKYIPDIDAHYYIEEASINYIAVEDENSYYELNLTLGSNKFLG